MAFWSPPPMKEDVLLIGSPLAAVMILVVPPAIVELYAQDSLLAPATTALPAVPATLDSPVIPTNDPPVPVYVVVHPGGAVYEGRRPTDGRATRRWFAGRAGTGTTAGFAFVPPEDAAASKIPTPAAPATTNDLIGIRRPAFPETEAGSRTW